MTYDLEKYRDKREKVLGVRRRGIKFGTLAAIVSAVILIGLSTIVIPKALAFFYSRHLDDAIYKMKKPGNLPQNFVSEALIFQGVKNVMVDKKGARIIVTFDRTLTDSSKLAAFFKGKGLNTILLNRVSHRQRQATLKKEAEFETP